MDRRFGILDDYKSHHVTVINTMAITIRDLTITWYSRHVSHSLRLKNFG